MRGSLIGSILLCATLFGQQTPPEPPKLEGYVVDTVTGQPVKKATVIIRLNRGNQEGLATFTDETGHFEFASLENGNWSAQIERIGYVMPGSSAALKELQWKVIDGAGPKEIKLRLTPAGVITGRVLDVDGEPVAGASVTLTPPDGKRGGIPSPFAQTNDQGEYRLYGAAPGRYVVVATYQPSWQHMPVRLAHKPGQAASGESYVATYHPSAAELGRAAMVTVPSGSQVSGIDIRLQKASAVRVRGRVMGADSSPFIMLSLMDASSGPHPAGSSEEAMGKPDGSFEFDHVRPGRYLLMGIAGIESEQRRGKQWVEVGSEPLDGIRLNVSPPQKIQGKLIVDGEGAIPAGLHAMLMSREEDPTHQGGGFSPVKPDGSFMMEQVYEGHYDLAFGRLPGGQPDDYYVSAIKVDKEDALNDGLRIGGGSTPLVQVILRNDGGTVKIKAAASNGDPIPGAHVLLLPDPPRQNAMALQGQGETDDHGELKLQGVAPGAYHALLFDPKQDLDPGMAKDAARIEKYGKPVVVKAKESVALDMRPAPSE